MTDTSRTTKNQRREDAREAARIAREKAKQRQKLLKWLIPTVSSVAIVAIVAAVVWAVIAFQPPPKKEAGPLNMISDGILFEGQDGKAVPVKTDAIAKGAEPVQTTPRPGILNIVTLVDFTCPVCKQFETAYSQQIQQLVADGQATLEVHPVAILDARFSGRLVSTRANNVGACVANYAPDSFLDVMGAMYENQADEGGPGLSNSDLVDIVKGAGLDDPDVNSCITGEVFTPWVTAATQRSGVRGTPTVIINGTQWDPNATPQFGDFVGSELAKLQ